MGLFAWFVLAVGAGGDPPVAGDVGPQPVRRSPAPPLLHPCKPEDVVVAAILSDRPEHLAATVHSVLQSASPSTCVRWEIFTTDTEAELVHALLNAEPLLDSPTRHSVSVTTLLEAEAALEEKGVTPIWLRPAFRKAVTGSPRRTLWSLREAPVDLDAKHSHPLNMLRFYLSELPQLQGDARVLLFDDDVCVRHDLRSLYHAYTSHVTDYPPGGEAAGALLVASCQMQKYEPSVGLFRIRDAEYTYADTRFLGTVGEPPAGFAVCDEDDELNESDPDCPEDEARAKAQKACAPSALEPKLMQLHTEISGRPTFHNETAWNFGVTLAHLQRWRSAGITRRMDRWFVANEHFGFFEPNSMSFGLGLAYLAFAGQVECWPTRTVLDGLGFLNWDDLNANGIVEDDVEVRPSGLI